MDKKKILIIVIMLVAITLVAVGVVFSLGGNDENKTLDSETYIAEDHVFETPDEVVTFLKNIYNTEEVEILSDDGYFCRIRAVSNDGVIYNYEFDIENKLLNTVDDETEVVVDESEVDDPSVVSES